MKSPVESDTERVPPFLKWAGGKRWFVKRLGHILPTVFNYYIEPFLGSGAVFFHLDPKKSKLGDKNSDLVETYEAISKDWRGVLEKLRKHERGHSEQYYYSVRNQAPRELTSRAARFIYLNRTCFNGLYRVNKRGKFNVPKGSKDTVIFPFDDFAALAKRLRNCTFHAGDFAYLIRSAKKGDFLYVDPPYTVRHNNNNFLKYNEVIFSWEDQVRLAGLLHDARRRGVQILVSNANHRSIRKLYQDFENVFHVSRHSILAANANARRSTTELIITTLGKNWED